MAKARRQPSPPWGPPGKQSGFLQNNIGWERNGLKTRKVGTGIGGKESVGYAMALEYGSFKMLPRPYLRPTLWEQRDRIQRIIATPMR